MKTVSLLTLCTIFLIQFSFAQKSEYEIKAKISGIPADKQIYLAHYFGNNQYIKIDSAKNTNGELVFKGNTPLKGGIYLIVLSKEKFYDLVISGVEKNITVIADTSDFLNSAKFKGSKENEILYNYRRFLKQKNEESKKIEKEVAAKTLSQEAAKVKLTNLKNDVNTYMKGIYTKNPNLFVSKIIQANTEVELPTVIPSLPNGKKDSTYLFNYYKNHYFDNLSFEDERFINTPFLQTKIDQYFDNLVYQIPDSVMVDADRILAKTKRSQEVYRYVLWEITDKYENSKVVGMEPVAVHLMENYYLKDAKWLDSATIAKFAKRVKTLKPILPGKIMPTLMLSDTSDVVHTVSDIKANKMVVIFFENNCGHCQESAPKIEEFAKANKNKGIEVVMVDTAYDLDKTKEFVKKYKLENVITLWDKFHAYDFYNYFDVYSTPTTYILDKDKKILAKRIPVNDLENYFEFLAKKEATNKK